MDEKFKIFKILVDNLIKEQKSCVIVCKFRGSDTRKRIWTCKRIIARDEDNILIEDKFGEQLTVPFNEIIKIEHGDGY